MPLRNVEGPVGLFLDDERWPDDVSEVKNHATIKNWARCPGYYDFEHLVENAEDVYGKFYDHVAFDWYLAGSNFNGDDCLTILISHFYEPREYPFPICTFHSSDREKVRDMKNRYRDFLKTLPADKRLEQNLLVV